MDASILTLTRDDLQSFIWDSYKEAYGIRPRFMDFESMSMDQLRKEADSCANAAEETFQREKEDAAMSVEEFKQAVQKTIELGANNEETALRWMTQAEEFDNTQCVESYVWSQGMLFTDYGRDLVLKLNKIVLR